MLGVGEVLPFSPTRRRAASLPVDVARTIEEALANLRARRRPRPRAVRAQRLERGAAPLAGAERRQLPRPHRADPLHAARAAAVAAVLRPAGRPHRQLPGDPRADAAVLPGRLPGDPARRRRRTPGRPATARARRAPVDRRRGAGGAAAVPAGAARAAARAGLARHGLVAAAAAAPATLSRALRERVEFVDAEPDHRGRRRWRGPTCSCSPPRGCGTMPGTLVRALAGRRRAGRLAAAGATRSCSADGEYGDEFEPGDVADAGVAPDAR